jgi:hypothetical protein
VEGNGRDLIYGIITISISKKTVRNMNATKQQILKLPHSPLRFHVRVEQYEKTKEGMTVKHKQPWMRTALLIKVYGLTGHRTVNCTMGRTYFGFKTERTARDAFRL